VATKVRRTRPSEWLEKAQTYLFNRYQVARAEKPRDAAKNWLKPYVLQHGVDDGDKGHVRVMFPQPMVIGTTTYYGLEDRRIPGRTYMDEDEVRTFLAGKPAAVRSRVIRKVTTEVVDTDELYALNQEGKVSDDELDSLLHQKDPTYQLWPVEEEPFE